MEPGLSALRLLIVDDNKQMRTIIGTVLSAAGVRHLFYATDGRQGLETLARTQIDIIYVDYEMPVMNGLDFISGVRSLTTPARLTPIIMLTGHSDRLRLTAARDRGVTEFLAKPVTARTILTRLGVVIDRPRPFVEAPTYFGPDRRRRATPDYAGPLRRRSDRVTVRDEGDFLEL